MKIEGIPDGWELVRIGKPFINERYISLSGNVTNCVCIPSGEAYAIVRKIRKIEKLKQFRPFANGDEFLSHPLHDGWIKLSSTAFTKVSQFDEKRFWVNNEEACYTWEDGFNLLKFRDGTPFGIEVTE